MGFSLHGILAAYPDGLTLSQLKKNIESAGFHITRAELLYQINLIPTIIKCKKRYKISTEQDESKKKLALAVKNLIKSLKQFELAAQIAKSYFDASNSDSESESTSSDDSDSTESKDDKMSRKFFQRKVKQPIYKRDVKIHSREY